MDLTFTGLVNMRYSTSQNAFLPKVSGFPRSAVDEVRRSLRLA
jgi:hypothetical protein